ncbi:MAG: hypothetical protein JSV84_01155 [Gemmatimonadota bacterium]|nr:MAG: hypothetical protein JSV84_01155 [Gemmatimonadota bacterium]
MFKHVLIVSTLIFLCVAMASPALPDIPQLISFQGKLYDDAGNPLTGEYALTFRIYDVETGGTHIWSEVLTVECNNGLYNAILGQTEPLNLAFEGQYWLGVRVTGDNELSPRYRLVSVPTAFRAAVAESAVNANALDGKNANDFADIEHQHDDRYYTETELSTNDGAVNESGDPVSWYRIKDMPAGFADGDDNAEAGGAGGGWVDEGLEVHLDSSADRVGMGTAAPGAKLDILTFEDDPLYVRRMLIGMDTRLLTVKNDGKVGIGTDSPEAKLDIENTNAAYHGGYFHIENSNSTFSGVYGETNGTGSGVTGHTSGSGVGVRGLANGTGHAGYFEVDNGASYGDAVKARTNGLNYAGHFEILNASNSAPSVYATTNGTGDAIQAKTNGWDNAGHFEITNASNSAPAVYATTNGIGEALHASSSSDQTILGENNGNGEAITGSTTGQGHAIQGLTSGSGYAVHGLTTGSTHAGFFEIDNSGSGSSALIAKTNGTGPAAYFEGVGGGDPPAKQWVLIVNATGGLNYYAAKFTGQVSVDGNIEAYTKSFRIDHPSEPDLDLVHGCLEGPESGVYYRGKAQLIDGESVVMLPDYFEALTREEDRTVLLTPIGKEPFTMSCSEVADGQFTVYGTKPDGKFFWEVKAVRADVDRLEVEVAKRP